MPDRIAVLTEIEICERTVEELSGLVRALDTDYRTALTRARLSGGTGFDEVTERYLSERNLLGSRIEQNSRRALQLLRQLRALQ